MGVEAEFENTDSEQDSLHTSSISFPSTNSSIINDPVVREDALITDHYQNKNTLRDRKKKKKHILGNTHVSLSTSTARILSSSLSSSSSSRNIRDLFQRKCIIPFCLLLYCFALFLTFIIYYNYFELNSYNDDNENVKGGILRGKILKGAVPFDKKIHGDSCRIAILSSYPPRPCGVGTFARSLSDAIQNLGCEVHIFALNHKDQRGYRTDYPEIVKYQIDSLNPDEFRRAGKYMNNRYYSFVIVQHEFSLYSGFGDDLITLLDQIDSIPTYAVVHNSHSLPTITQLACIRSLAERVDKLVLMSYRSVYSYIIGYGIPVQKLQFIHHGVIDIPQDSISEKNSRNMKKELGIDIEKNVIVTFGLLHRKKGVNLMIDALPYIVDKYPNTLYIVLGQVNLDETRRNIYQMLKEQAKHNNVSENVLFYNQFISDKDLTKYLMAADIYVTPYFEYTPISGTLSYAMAVGKAVVSTRYMYAKELLADNRGKLVSMANPNELAKTVNSVLANNQQRFNMGLRAYQFTRDMTWKKVAYEYLCMVSRYNQDQTDSVTKIVLQKSNDTSCNKHINDEDLCIPWKLYKTRREGIINFNYMFGFDRRRLWFDNPLTYYSDNVFNLFTDPYLQINAKFSSVSRLWKESNMNVIEKISIIWRNLRLIIDAANKEVELMPDNETFWKQLPQGMHVHIGYLADRKTKYVRLIKAHYYTIDISINMMPNIESGFPYALSWLDFRMSILNDIVSPHGILGQSNQFIHEVDRKMCEAPLSSPTIVSDHSNQPVCSVIEGVPNSYLVGDGLLGNQFFFNIFLNATSAKDNYFCNPAQFNLLFKKKRIFWDPKKLKSHHYQMKNYWDRIRSMMYLNSKIKIIKKLKTKNPNIFMIYENHWNQSEKYSTYDKMDSMYYISLQTCDLGVLPKIMSKELNDKIDEIWVPSEASKRCYQSSGIPLEKIFVIPPFTILNKFILPKRKEMKNILTGFKDLFKLLFIGPLSPESGIDILLDTYRNTFTASDNIILIVARLSHQYYDHNPQNKQFLKQTIDVIDKMFTTGKTSPKIVVLDEPFEVSKQQLYASVNAFVHPFRVDNVGITLLEAMSSELPVITTAAGAAPDFCHPFNSYLVSSKEMACSNNIVASTFHNIVEPSLLSTILAEQQSQGQFKCAEPDQSDLSRVLKHVYENQNESKYKGMIARRGVQLTRRQAIIEEVLSLRMNDLEEKIDSVN